MKNIKEYLSLSHEAAEVKEIYTEADLFRTRLRTIKPSEKMSFLYHYIINNVPYAFCDQPILYERLLNYIADELDVFDKNIVLVGSAKTGFSMKPNAYGRLFGNHSDLDLAIIDRSLFLKLADEFNNWKGLFEEGKIRPKAREVIYWKDNVDTGTRQIRNNFIDTKYTPNRDIFPNTQFINNTMWKIKIALAFYGNIDIKKANLRVYNDWVTLIKRLNNFST